MENVSLWYCARRSSGVFFEVVQRVVHPAQVPLVVEAQPAVFHRSSHLGEIGGILCDEHRCGMQTPQAGIHCLQK